MCDLARLGAEQDEYLVVTEESAPPSRHFVLEDALGVFHHSTLGSNSRFLFYLFCICSGLCFCFDTLVCSLFNLSEAKKKKVKYCF